MSGYISTHVLDLTAGSPGASIAVSLLRSEGENNWKELMRTSTNVDGRVPSFQEDGSELLTGRYRLVFELEPYFSKRGLKSILPEAVLSFIVADSDEHYHIPLLLSPNGFTTYRGS